VFFYLLFSFFSDAKIKRKEAKEKEKRQIFNFKNKIQLKNRAYITPRAFPPEEKQP